MVVPMLIVSLTVATALRAESDPWAGRAPACERHLGNVDGYLHDFANNPPADLHPLRADGIITEEARLDDPDAIVRALVAGSFLQSAVGPLGKLVRPRRRGILRTAGFRERIPRRDRRYIRALGERGFVTTTTDDHFAAVLEMCAHVERHDFDRATGRRARDAGGRPIKVATWLSAETRVLYNRLNVHPERYARSRAAWLTRADGTRRLVGGIIWVMVAGVPTGETMCMDRSVASGIGKLLLHDLLAELEAAGHPWLDVQEVHVDRLPARWGAVEINRAAHEAALRERQAYYASSDRPLETR